MCASIHQPRSSIYQLFDKLCLVSEGRILYYGDANKCVDYFASMNPSYACPRLFNPADYFLDIVSIEYASAESELESIERVRRFDKSWREVSSSYEDVQVVETSSADVEVEQTYQATFLRQIQLLQWRSFVASMRNRSEIISKVVPPMFFAVVMGILYSDTSNNQQSIQNIVGALFFFTINQTFGNLFGVLNSFSSEKILVERERSAKAYRLSSFYVGKLFAEIPINIISPIIFGSIVYWIIGLNPDPERFFVFLLILLEVTKIRSKKKNSISVQIYDA